MLRIAGRFIVALLILLCAVILSVLYIPAVTRYLLQYSSDYYLGHPLHVHAYHFNPSRLHLAGTFDDNSTVNIDATDLLGSSRRLSVTMNTSAAFFSHASGTELPDVAVHLQAQAFEDHIRLDAEFLGGSLNAEMETNTLEYRYALRHIKLERIFSELQLPIYAEGEVSADGNGSADSPYPHNSKLKSYNITLQKPFESAVGLYDFPSPTEMNATGTIAFTGDHRLQMTFDLDSALFIFKSDHSEYDISSGALAVSAELDNGRQDLIPLKQVFLLYNGRHSDGNLTGDVRLDADNMRLSLSRAVYAEKTQTFLGDYRLSTLSSRPYNLSGSNALSGHISYKNNQLQADAATADMTDPVHILYSDGNVSAISNNIPLKTLFAVLNMPDAAYGNFHFKASALFRGDAPVIALDAASNNFALRTETMKELNLTSPLSIRVSAAGNPEKRFQARLDLNRCQCGHGTVTADYNVAAGRAVIDGKLQHVRLPWYSSKSLALHSKADLKQRILTDTTLTTPFDSISISRFSFNNELNATLYFRVKQLDRWMQDANGSYVLNGRADISRQGSKTDITVSEEKIGTFSAALLPDGTRILSSENIALGQLFALSGRPSLLSGVLSLHARQDDESVHISFSSSELTPSSELNSTLRPFPIESNASFVRSPLQHYIGTVSLTTASDAVTLTSIELDPSGQHFSSRYRIELRDIRQSAIILPSNLFVNTLSLEGQTDLGVQQQSMTLRSDKLFLSPEIHHFFDQNATAPLPIFIDMNATHDNRALKAEAEIFSKPFSLAPLAFRHNADTGAFSLASTVHSTRIAGDTAINFSGFLSEGNVIDNATLTADSALYDLNVTRLHIDRKTKDYSADFALHFGPLQNNGSDKKASFFGHVRTQPAFDASFHSASLEGNLSGVMNNDLLIIHASQLQVPRLARFVSSNYEIESGTLSGSAILSAQALLDGNLSRLGGGIDFRLQDFQINGIEIDSYLETLRNTQDLSLFQGSLSELPIVRTVKQLPKNVLSTETVKTEITDARLAASVKHGILVCEDCAAATPEHRVAFAGNIDLASQRFDTFYAALLKPDGCPYFMQQVNGKLTDPQINLAVAGVRVISGTVVSLASNVTEAANWLTKTIYSITTATGKVIQYVPIAGKTADETLDTVAGALQSTTERISRCTPFYVGSVPPPDNRLP